MLDEHGFGDNGTRAAGTGQSGDRCQQVQKENGQIAHRTILPRSRHQELLRNVAIRHAHPILVVTKNQAHDHRVLICDRDTKWSAPVRARLREAGVHVVQTPYQAPNANASAERFVRSIKEECLNQVVVLGEAHLRRTLTAFVAHYHRERSHQGLENELIAGAPPAARVGRIRRHQRLGGLLNYYDRAA